MLIDIQNERPVGYITLDEYAEKHNVKTQTVRVWAKGGKFHNLLRITCGGRSIMFIPADEPLPHLNPTGIARKGREKMDKLIWPPDEYYTVSEFAQKVGASQSTVWQWCHRGYLKYFKTDTGKGARLLIAKDTPIPEKCYYQKGVMK